MKRRWVAVALVSAAMVAGPAAPARAKSLEVVRLEQRIRIARDGSFTVAETRTIAFDGSFSRAFLTFPKGDFALTDFTVSEPGIRYARARDAGEAPGTYLVEDSSSAVTVRWFYRAADEERAFTISYRVLGHIVAYDDVAEFYWKFVGGESDVTTRNVDVAVTLPAATSDLRVWGHGPLEGEVHPSVAGDGASWRLGTLPPRTFLEGRMTFPPSLVPGARRIEGQRLPQILAEERSLADRANRARLVSRVWNLAAPIAALLSLAFFGWLFLRFGREPAVADPGKYLREPPADHPPAIVGYLMRFGGVRPVDMVATLMDLARRGYVRIGEIRQDRGVIVKKAAYDYRIQVVRDPDPSLEPYEREVLDLLHESSGEYGVTDDELKAWAKADPARMQAHLAAFTREVKAHARRLGLIEPRAHIIAGNVVAAVLALVIVVFAFTAQVGSATDARDVARFAPGPIAGLGLLGAQLGMTPLLRRRTFRGATEHRAWSAFRDFLKDFSRMDEYRPTAIAMWERYLVFAIPLGVADEVARAIKIHAPAEVATQGFAWYAFSSDGGSQTFGDSMTSFASTFTASAAAAFSTSPSSGGGEGGGFSGGGDGGGGGGGGDGGGSFGAS